MKRKLYETPDNPLFHKEFHFLHQYQNGIYLPTVGSILQVSHSNQKPKVCHANNVRDFQHHILVRHIEHKYIHSLQQGKNNLLLKHLPFGHDH